MYAIDKSMQKGKSKKKKNHIYFSKVVGLNLDLSQRIASVAPSRQREAGSVHDIVKTFRPSRVAGRAGREDGEFAHGDGPIFKGDQRRFGGSCAVKNLQTVTTDVWSGLSVRDWRFVSLTKY